MYEAREEEDQVVPDAKSNEIVKFDKPEDEQEVPTPTLPKPEPDLGDLGS
jgi:hypothetical protein